MRALGEPDAFPSSDLGLLRASAIASSRELESRAEPWRPWRSYAAMYLWRMASREKKVVKHKARKQQAEVTSAEPFDDERLAI